MKIEVKNCTKYYGNTCVLKNINFTLEPGIYALLGPNGAGKSTIMKILCTLLMQSEGMITYNGVEISKCKHSYSNHIGYMPQHTCLYEDFTLFDFLGYMGVMKGMKKEEIKKRCSILVKQVELEDVLHKKIKSYSGGMKQRAMLCVALLNDPLVLILDEPTAGLDPLKRMEVQKIIAEFSKDKIILIATHVVSDVEFIADKFLILKEGELIENTTRLNLINLLLNQVVEVKTTVENYRELEKKYKISALRYDADTLIARILNPGDELVGELVNPNVSDVYLHLFGDSDVAL